MVSKTEQLVQQDKENISKILEQDILDIVHGFTPADNYIIVLLSKTVRDRQLETTSLELLEGKDTFDGAQVTLGIVLKSAAGSEYEEGTQVRLRRYGRTLLFDEFFDVEDKHNVKNKIVICREDDILGMFS